MRSPDSQEYEGYEAKPVRVRRKPRCSACLCTVDRVSAVLALCSSCIHESTFGEREALRRSMYA